MLYKNRKKYAHLENKIASFFSRISPNPNFWTFLSLLFAIAAAYLVTRQLFLFAGLSFAFSSLLDLVDGSIARRQRKVTKFGAYLDTISDRYAEAVVIAALVFVPLPFLMFPSYAWIMFLLFGSLMTTYSKASAVEKGLPSPIGVLLERAERVFLLFVGIFFGHFNKIYLLYIIILLAILTNITALQRIRMVFK